jgi:hypothetical protein
MKTRIQIRRLADSELTQHSSLVLCRDSVPPKARGRVLIVNEGDPPGLIKIKDLVLFAYPVVLPTPCSAQFVDWLEDGNKRILRFPPLPKIISHHIVVEPINELHYLAGTTTGTNTHSSEMIGVENVVAIKSRGNDPRSSWRQASHDLARLLRTGTLGIFHGDDANSIVPRLKPPNVCLGRNTCMNQEEPREIANCLTFDAWKAVLLEQLTSASLPYRIEDSLQARIVQATGKVPTHEEEVLHHKVCQLADAQS